MIILQFAVVTLLVKICHTEFIQIFHPFTPASAPLMPICPFPQHQPMPLPLQPISDITTAVEKPKENLNFILPFLDIEIKRDRNLHVMQEVQKQQIYILHGRELYQMFISRQEKRLSLVALLEGGVHHVEPLGAKIVYWHGNFLLVIALDEYLEVYQLPEDVLRQHAEILKDPTRHHEHPPIFEAIQQLTLTGRFQEFFLFSPHKDRIIIVAAVNFTKLYGKLRIFEWFNTYFDPIEEITVPAMHVVNVIGFQTKYLITGRTIRHQTKTILTIYEISPLSPNLVLKQTLTVESRVVHMFTYINRNMIVACSSKQQKCSSFRQKSDGHFSIYRQRSPNEFAFDLVSSSSRFVSATRQNKVMVFTNHRLDCYGSFITNQFDVAGLIGYQNAYREDYLLLVYKRPFKTLVRVVEFEINVKDLPAGNHTEAEDILASSRHQHLFESTVGQLRSILLKSKIEMDVLRKVLHILRPQEKDIEVGERLVLHEGNVRTIKIVGESLRSPMQIIQTIQSLRQKYLLRRSRRSAKQGLLNTSRNATNRLKVHKIKVKNLLYQGDVIKGFSLSQKNLHQKLLTIKQSVTTHALNTTELKLLPNTEDKRRQAKPDLFHDLIPPVHVSHLKVDSINGVSWNTFYNSIFLKNRDKLVQGRLVLQSQVNVKHMMVTILNGLVVSNLFNLKHPQVIHSDLVLSRFTVHNLRAKTVNGLIFEDDIVFSGNNSLIETPVIINHLRITGDVFLANNTKLKPPSAKLNEIQFKQFYTNKVIVNGSLILNNLNRLHNKTKIILEDQEFDENVIREKYLLKEYNQNFSFPVNFEDAKVTAPHLESSYLNDHKTEQHLLVNKANTNKPLYLVFMNAHVQGDVVCRDYKSKIAEIKENIIRPGDKVNVTGIKVFKAPLEIQNLEQVLTFNQLSVHDLVFKSLLRNDNAIIQFKGSKVFTAIKVKNSSHVDKELKALYLNNLLLESLLNNDYYIDRLSVPHLVQASNIVFHKINGIPFDEFFTKLDVQDEHLILHKDLIVEGSVEFAEALELQYINGIAWNEYVDSLVRLNENAIIEGAVSFDNNLTITKAFETRDINAVDLEMILQNVLMKSRPQLITALYHFDNINGSHMDVLTVNDVNILEFVDLTKNIVEISGDITVEKLNVRGNLQGNLNNYLSLLAIKEKASQLPLRLWKNVYVLNNVSWPSHVKNNDQYELLKYLYKSAVKTNHNQIITGNVKLSKPLIANMQTRLKFPPNVDIDFIHQDGLLRNSSDRQHIKGIKVFLKALHMKTLRAKALLNTKILNQIDVSRFNKSLYRLSSHEPLQGPLKFIEPLSVDVLKIQGLINNLNSSLIYELKPSTILPAVILQELYIENGLYVKNINDMSVEYFLDNRLTLRGPALEHFGILTFENLVIEKEVLIQGINGISIDNMVFKHSPYLQTIKGHKTVKNTLELIGPAHITRINNKDLADLHHNSLKKHNSYQFDSLVIKQATFQRGLQVLENIIFSAQQRSVGDSENTIDNERQSFLKFLKEFKANITNSNKNIQYLDYDLNATINWLDAKIPHTPLNQTILYELSRILWCEKVHLHVFFQYPNNIYLKNITSDRLVAISNKISVKAENYCRLQNRRVKSKITISGPKLLKVFGMKRYIESIYSLEFVEFPQQHFVILHALDLPTHRRNEVRIFKISKRNNTISDWQGLTKNIGDKLKLYKFSSLHTLITNGLVDHHPAVTIYHFNYTSQLFQFQQSIVGDYDIIEMIELPNNAATKQLILSCSNCQRIFIYELTSNTSSHSSSQITEKYEIFQLITPSSHIDKLLTFCLGNECYLLVLSQRNSNFYVYKYSYIQGWLPLTFGHFPNSHMSIPLTELWSRDDILIASKNSNSMPLILLCNVNDCYLLSAVV